MKAPDTEARTESGLRAGVWLLRGALLASLLGVCGVARAESFEVFSPAAPGSGFEESFGRALENARAPEGGSLDLVPATRFEILRADVAARAEAEVAAQPQPKEKTIWIGAVTVAVLAGSAYNSFFDGERQKYHFTDEGWFGRNTYAGGGDKASHFVSFYVVSKLLSGVFQELDAPTDRARLLGSGVSFLAGLMTEIGDGTIRYGFSFQDLIVDAVGAATALGIAHYGLDDLAGFRAGLVPAPEAVCCPNGLLGKDYTREIYTGDLKIEGLARRLHFHPGPARYLLLSLSYGSKGYPYSDPVVRERQIGVEVGLNFGEIMRDIGVPQKKWWGKILYFVFDVIRFPYTQIGMYYDLNSGQWRGPSIGDSFPGGP